MNAIVLAAGNGRRFDPPLGLPKCLLQFGGKTLLARHIENFTRLGVETITIVAGYQAERVDREVRQLNSTCCVRYNPNFEQGSIGSLCQVADVLGTGECLITNGDLLYDANILRQIVRSPLPNVSLIDSLFQDSGEEFYVWGENGHVRAFDHPIHSAHIVGEGVGITKSSALVGALWAQAAQALVQAEPYAEYQSALECVLPQAALAYLDIQGCAWTDVDDWNDVAYAERVIYPVLVERGQG